MSIIGAIFKRHKSKKKEKQPYINASALFDAGMNPMHIFVLVKSRKGAS